MRGLLSCRPILFSLIFIFALSNAQFASANVDPPNASGATEFDWQNDWGSIHMNSYADGLNDPGSHATLDGSVPCERGKICQVAGEEAKTASKFLNGTAISNGIKFDIKNSLLNCVSQPMPTWAFNNIWNPWDTVCNSANGLSWPAQYSKAKDRDDDSPTGFPHTLEYAPIWDRRSNDTRSKDVENIVGCQQQVSNSCVQDMHACINVTNPNNPIPPAASEAGFLHPISHVFTPQEVADLGGKGTQLPTTYWSYKKNMPAVGAKPAYVRDALSTSDPTAFSDTVAGSVVAIQNTFDSHLARLKTYTVDNPVSGEQSIVVDPSDFFDLKLYVANGKYDAGYNKFDSKTKLVEVPESCPVAGLGSGYGGICDPTPGPDNAGCNLPIYDVGAKTTFTSSNGKVYTYANYSVSWSGYVKKWAVISVAQYLENIRGREDVYLDGKLLNNNNIIMLTRANDYCEATERMSDPSATGQNGLPLPPDMPCIQYLQYQATDEGNTVYAYVDLYNPSEHLFPTKAEYNILTLYNLDANGKPMASSPVGGTGPNRYIFGNGSNTNTYLSFKDVNAKYSYVDGTSQKTASAIYKASYKGGEAFDSSGKRISGPVYSTILDSNDNQVAMPGEYLGKNGQGGAGISLTQGTAVFIATKGSMSINGNSTSCSVTTLSPTAPNKLFIPTNTYDEINSFLNSYAATDPSSGVQVRPCDANFVKSSLAATTGEPAIGGVNTWVGMSNCDGLTVRPTCNTTRMISAKRYCQIENGSLGNCAACGGVTDPDDKNYFRNSAKNVTGEAIILDPGRSLDPSGRCYFTASCFNNSATGCPAAGTSGGHVFCFGPETKITMSDGTQKAIKYIKAGEEVVSFNGKSTRNAALGKAKIIATALTKNQRIIKINDFKITPLHKIVLLSGRAVAAQDIKVGDKMLKADGLVEVVKTVDANLKPISVYNLVLEKGSDGYIANGIRVMSYPIIKGMEVMSGSLADQSNLFESH